MMATDIIHERSFERVDDDPDGRYARVLDDTSYARAEQGPLGQSLRIGSSARVPLDVAGGPEQRTQGVVNLGRVPYVRSWRVTLGEPRIENEGIFAAQGGDIDDVAYNVNPVLALLEWGVQGATFTAEVDWGRGNSFVLSADYINVKVQCLNLVGTPSTPNPAVAIFPATIAPSESGSPPAYAPMRTIYSGVIAPAGLANVKVPAFARTIRLIRVATANPAEAFQFAFYANTAKTQRVWLDNSITSGNWTTNLSDLGGGPHAAIPAQAILMEIASLGVANMSFMCQFGLDLG